MIPIDGKLLLDWLEKKRAKLASANKCGGCAVELLDEIIRAVKLMPQAVGFVQTEELVPVKWPEAAYPSKLQRIGESEIAAYLENLQAEMQTHEAMFLRLKQLERERAEFMKALDGDCETCANAGECVKYPCFCINGSAWEWGGNRAEETSGAVPVLRV